MKRILFSVTMLLLSGLLYGQSPDKMSYQAVIRDAANCLVVNQQVGIQISIQQSSTTGTSVYVETH
ncbi:MAG: hypothetical protein ACI9RM_002912, partial [Ulvibacter sp.]